MSRQDLASYEQTGPGVLPAPNSHGWMSSAGCHAVSVGSAASSALVRPRLAPSVVDTLLHLCWAGLLLCPGTAWLIIATLVQASRPL